MSLDRDLTVSALVDDSDEGYRVHRRVYTDPTVFDAEVLDIFSRTWVYVGHVSEVPRVGDYKTTTMATQPVIISHHDGGRITVLFNRCRHRGTVVCRDQLGHSNFFRCPYHNWVYRNDGQLVGVAMAEGYPADLDKAALGLRRVPRVGVYRGLIFASLADDGPGLEEHLGRLRPHIDMWLSRSPLGSISVLPTAHQFDYPGNWKWQAENGTDSYHGNYVHESWQRVLQRAGEAQVKDVRQFRSAGCARSFNYGHSLLQRPGGLNPNSSWTGRMLDRYPDYRVAMEARYDVGTIDAISAKLIIFVFPNMFLFDTHIRIIEPLAVNRTLVRFDVYGLDGVPEEMNVHRYRAHERFFGPAGFGTPDDLEIFVASETGSHATHAEWSMASRGQHREKGRDGERVGDINDETPMRSLYREWKRLMGGTSAAAGDADYSTRTFATKS